MTYVLTDKNAVGLEAYWYGQATSLSAAEELAREQYPEAKYIIEYREDLASKGILPTGRSWSLEKQS